MEVEKIFQKADFSKESNFKERLYNRLKIINSIQSIKFDNDDEIADYELINVVAAAGGYITVPVNFGKKLED